MCGTDDTHWWLVRCWSEEEDWLIGRKSKSSDVSMERLIEHFAPFDFFRGNNSPTFFSSGFTDSTISRSDSLGFKFI